MSATTATVSTQNPAEIQNLSTFTHLRKKRLMRQDYIDGNGSIPSLCKKYSVNVETGYRWRNAEKWNDLLIKREQNDIAALTNQPTAQPDPVVIQSTPIINPTDSLSRISAKLRALEEQLNETTDPSENIKLAGAHEKLFKAWQVLANIPNPGQRRPEAAKSRSTRSEVAPASIPAPEPQRAPTPAAGLFADNRPVDEPESQL